MLDDNAFEDGYEAYWEGVDPDDNPFSPGTAHASSWDEGWSQAQLEDADSVSRAERDNP